MSTRVEVTVAFEFGTDDHAVALVRATDKLTSLRGARITHTRTFRPMHPDPYSDSDTDDPERTP